MTIFHVNVDLHKDGNRQGLGSPEHTRLAFDVFGASHTYGFYIARKA
jgi:hypothetical protein